MLEHIDKIKPTTATMWLTVSGAALIGSALCFRQYVNDPERVLLKKIEKVNYELKTVSNPDVQIPPLSRELEQLRTEYFKRYGRTAPLTGKRDDSTPFFWWSYLAFWKK